MSKLNFPVVGRSCAVLVGIAFIVSGFAKSVDATYFANIIAGYGIVWLGYLSPVIIVFEVLLGAFILFTNYHRLRFLQLAIATLLLFTATYTYGLLFKDIQNCGCFGDIPFINDGPIMLYIKNSLLIIAAIYAIKSESSESARINPTGIVVIILSGLVASFISGQTFSPLRTSRQARKSISLTDSELQRFVSPQPNKTALVFLFSYSCPHCLNSIANLNEYRKSNCVDTIIAFATGSPKEATWFKENFNIDFDCATIGNDLFKVTTKFPHAYLIQGDSIIAEHSGELPCHQLFPFP